VTFLPAAPAPAPAPPSSAAGIGTAPAAARRQPRAVLGALVALTKPRIIELLLVTTVPTMLLAQHGLPSLRLVLVTLVGGTLAAGSANTINCYIDRDIDALMKRTSRRPLVNKQGAVKPAEALAWGILLGVAATVLLGLQGCFPVLVAWAAVKDTIGIPAIVLFAVIFLWTPPHFWALAMKFKDDYARASVPMLPVVASPVQVTRKIVVYSYAMVAATLALAPYAGWVYTAAAVAMGAWFLLEAHRLHAQVKLMSSAPAAEIDSADPAPRAFPMRLFHLSIAYLTLLFVAVAICALLPIGHW
jgi:protoheme IX farnesyltransferase